MMADELDYKIDTVQVKNWPCHQLRQNYVLKNQLGRGTYGAVYKAHHIIKQTYFALKKMEYFQQKNDFGFNITTLRQIKLLQKLSHINILNINEVVYDKPEYYRHRNVPPTIYLCLDLMECDLNDLIKQKQNYQFSIPKIQNIIKQILQAMKYLHQRSIAHRDIKPSNVLLNREGVVKVADFGLAKKLVKVSTVKVCTLWYRAPELLLGLKNYTTKIDIWSVGCLLAQLILRQPLFKEQVKQKDLINRIYSLMGTPDQCNWTQVEKLETYIQTKPQFSSKSQIIYHIKKNASKFQEQHLLLDLLEKMLRINPHSRFSAEQCLNHQFFKIHFQQQPLFNQKIIKFLELKQKQFENDQIVKRIKRQ